MTGVVQHFNAAKGTGTLRGLDGRLFFFQLRDCDALEDALPIVGEELEFSPELSGTRPRAVAIARPRVTA